VLVDKHGQHGLKYSCKTFTFRLMTVCFYWIWWLVLY